MDRFRFERHVEAAALPGPSVAILMMLARRVNRAQGAIPDADQPSLAVLARATGYDKATVARHVHELEQHGWLYRSVPPKWAQQKLHMPTHYTLLVPEGYPRASRTVQLERAARSEMAERSAPAGLATRNTKADGDSATGAVAGGPGAGSRRRDRSQESKSSRSSPGPEEDIRQQAELAKTARDELARLTGRTITLRAAVEAVRLVLDGRQDIKNPSAYLLRALRADPARFAPPAGPPSLADVEADLNRKLREDTP